MVKLATKHLQPSLISLSAGTNCFAYAVTWRLADKVFGIGWYGFDLRVKDEDGALSNVIHKQWFTGD